MTIQQLRYIVTLNKFRHFAKASEHCGVSQPTLSLMIKKLEEELDVTIFDRGKQPIEPTVIGKRIIKQAENSLREMEKIEELVVDETKSLSGALRIGLIPTLAPYLVPNFIQKFKQNYKEIDLTISELQTSSLIEALKNEELDMFIAATPLEEDEFYEIPVYYEKFLAYFAASNPFKDIQLSANNMPQENLWVLQEGHCVRDQVFNFCQKDTQYNHIFEAGSIETLVRIVDRNAGYTVIPELHIDYLTQEQKQNVRDILNPPAVREISIVIKNNFIKERMINAVADTIKAIMPQKMLDERLKKFSIKLL